MRFTKIIGKCDPAIVKQAEDKLSSVFTELSLGYDNKSLGSNLGGDPFVFSLIYPFPHICDAMGLQLDDFDKRQKEIEKKIADGEELTKEERDQISDEVKKYRKHMGKRVLRTAATNGRQFFWAPDFVNSKSRLGLRLVIMHESLHAHLLHPSRVGSRMPKLFNIAIDYKVNHVAMMDLKTRGRKDFVKDFTDNLGDFIRLEELVSFYRDPFNPPARLAHLNPIEGLKSMADPNYKHPGDDKEPLFYGEEDLGRAFETHAAGDMLKPENIYSYLLSCIPKCPKCGKLGMYKKPEEYKKLQKQIEEQQKAKAEEEKKAGKGKEEEEGADGDPGTGKKQPKKNKGQHQKDAHNHDEDGESCEHGKPQRGQGKPSEQGEGEEPGEGQEGAQGQPSDGDGQKEGSGQPQPGEGEGCSECGGGNGCSECGGGSGSDSEYVDVFGAGSELDEHMSTDVSEDEMAKRLYDAAEMAKKLGGKVPMGLEDQIGELLAPKIRWEDLVRQMMTKKRDGAGRNDWQKPKSRPLFAGLYVPKKRDFFLNVLVAYDCSGSMSKDDIAFGISQLQVIDNKGEMFCCPFDCTAYWDQMVKINKADMESLSKIKAVGRGGTDITQIFNEYEKYCGKVDLIICITDSYLSDPELTHAKIPPKGTDTLWLITSDNKSFRAPFGRTLNLRNE